MCVLRNRVSQPGSSLNQVQRISVFIESDWNICFVLLLFFLYGLMNNTGNVHIFILRIRLLYTCITSICDYIKFI